ncbi:MAG: septal ring lytic transglycosylase RlpA family protein, partial [Deinococcus sp.]|nr:septal ring lytic transglycosylase RlpA family protein [Deinococcus sp.]
MVRTWLLAGLLAYGTALAQITDRPVLAAWYGIGLTGQPTASGEPFDPSALTAAHRTLPFGTLLRLTNMANQRSVVVRINDRGPSLDRIEIDVTRQAAELLDFVARGVALVRLEMVSSASEAYTLPAPEPASNQTLLSSPAPTTAPGRGESSTSPDSDLLPAPRAQATTPAQRESSTPQLASAEPPATTPSAATLIGPTLSPQSPSLLTAIGVASWYGPGFEGQLTASGEVYNSRLLTAAHRTLPFDSLVRVTNLTNGAQVIVRINDRGPFIPGRDIDLSRRAAEILGFVATGTAQVRLEVLTPGRPEP